MLPLIVTTSLLGLSLPPGSACVALGLFDGLHLGHRAVLEAMVDTGRLHGLEPVVFTFHMDRCRPEGKRDMTRLLRQETMERMLEEMGVARMIRPAFDEFRGMSPEEFAGLLARGMGAARVVCGYNFRFGRDAAGTTELLARLCGELGVVAEIVPAVEANGEAASSRRIRHLLREGEIEEANRMLGYPFFIDFAVVAGRKLGRTLGWPTINQPFPEDFTLPRFGVYATLTEVDGHPRGSVTNVVVRPTVGGGQVLAETYIQDFSGDLYRKNVTVRFLRFLRPEQEFPDLAALKERISADARQAADVAERYISQPHSTSY